VPIKPPDALLPEIDVKVAELFGITERMVRKGRLDPRMRQFMPHPVWLERDWVKSTRLDFEARQRGPARPRIASSPESIPLPFLYLCCTICVHLSPRLIWRDACAGVDNAEHVCICPFGGGRSRDDSRRPYEPGRSARGVGDCCGRARGRYRTGAILWTRLWHRDRRRRYCPLPNCPRSGFRHGTAAGM
jgi:hypothetical protein